MNYNKLLTIVSKNYFGFNFQKPLRLNLRQVFSPTMLFNSIQYAVKVSKKILNCSKGIRQVSYKTKVLN